ncbi:hypothetical protein QMK34_47625, partial [Amycolatopsis sp. H20-H5]|nr:hypothetical protein [Amycolatopsis sp. H20-H5]
MWSLAAETPREAELTAGTVVEAPATPPLATTVTRPTPSSTPPPSRSSAPPPTTAQPAQPA